MIRRFNWHIIILCFMLVLTLFFFRFIDRPFMLWLVQVQPQWLYDFFETFTHTLDIIFLGKFLYLSDYYAWASVIQIMLIRYLPLGIFWWISLYFFKRKTLSLVIAWVIVCHGLSTALTLLFKYMLSRSRPNLLINQGVYLLSFPGGLGDSFPSGHTIDYMALFLPFALYYRYYAPLILIIPLGIALGRIVLWMHYPSDVFVAIYLVLSTALLGKKLIFRASIFSHKPL